MSKLSRNHVLLIFLSLFYTVARCTGGGFIREDEGLLQTAVEAVSDLIADAQSLLLASR